MSVDYHYKMQLTFMVYWLPVKGNAVPPIVNERIGKDGIDAQFTYSKIVIKSWDCKSIKMNNT